MFGFLIWTSVPDRQCRFYLERSSEIFTHRESRHHNRVSTTASDASRAAFWKPRPFTNQRPRPLQQVEGCVPLTNWKPRLFDNRGLRPLQQVEERVSSMIKGCIPSSTQSRVSPTTQSRISPTTQSCISILSENCVSTLNQVRVCNAQSHFYIK